MKILVLVKPVPDPEKYKDIIIDPQTKRIIRENVPSVINPTDRNALEAALDLKEKLSTGGENSSICVLAMAPESSRDKLTECLAMGADEAYLLSDRLFGGADTFATSYVLAEGIKKIEDKKGENFDLVLAGNSSADGATSHVPVQVAERLGMTHICNVCSLEKEDGMLRAVKRSEDVMLTFEGTGRAVMAVTRDINKPRLINAMGIIKARKKPLITWTNEDMGLDKGRLGMEGSPTKPGKLMALDMSRAGENLADNPEDAAKAILQIIGKAGA